MSGIASNRTIVILDTQGLKSGRPLSELVASAGFQFVETGTVEQFISSLKESQTFFGIIAYERILDDPKKILEGVKASIPNGKRIAVAYHEGTRQLRIAHKLRDTGAVDFLVPRSDSPFSFKALFRQAYFDFVIEKRIDQYMLTSDPKQFQGDRLSLMRLGPALLGCRTFDDIWRTFALQIPSILDVAMISVLVIEKDVPRIYVLPFRRLEHQCFWELEQKVCQTAEIFHYASLDVSHAEYSDVFLNAAEPKPLDASMRIQYSDPIPMVSNGKLVGCVGIAMFGSDASIAGRMENVLVPLSLHLSAALVNVQLLAEIESHSVTDELTGAFNRRYLRDLLDRELVRSRRYQSPFCIAILDIDHFKEFNDVFGHQKGDLVLKEFAAYISGQLRNSDRLIRLGGEEFLIFLPATDISKGTLAVERLRSKLHANPLDSIREIGSFRFSFSGGLVCFPDCGLNSTFDEMIAHADEALYQAKQTGRDRICIYKNPGPVKLSDEHEKRKSPRIDCQLSVRFAEVPNFSPKFSATSTLNISAGGLSIIDPDNRLKKNNHLLIYLSDHHDPMLCRVAWSKSSKSGERTAGLEFVKSPSLNTGKGARPKTALIVAECPALIERTMRILNAAQYKSVIWDSEMTINREVLEDFSLLVIGETSFRKEIGQLIQKIRMQEDLETKIILINEEQGRRQALEEIPRSKIEHLVANDDSAMETLFAGLNKMILGEIFGIKKYLMWGADSVTWQVCNSADKDAALEGVQKYAISVKCHKRVADLLVLAVDEMLINAMYSGVKGKEQTVTVECGSDGRLLIVSVLDEIGALNSEDIYRSLGLALENQEKGFDPTRKSVSMGFQIMLSNLSQLSINISPGKCTEVIGIIDLRKSLKEYRSSVPSLGIFTKD